MDTTNLPLVAPLENPAPSTPPGQAVPVADGTFPAGGPNTAAPAGDMFSLVLLQRLLGLAKRGDAEHPAVETPLPFDPAVTLAAPDGKPLPSGAELPEAGVNPEFLATLRGAPAPVPSASAATLQLGSNQTPAQAASGLPVTPASPSAAIPPQAELAFVLGEAPAGEGRSTGPVLPASPALNLEVAPATQSEANAPSSVRPAEISAQLAPSQQLATSQQLAPSQQPGMPSATSPLLNSLEVPVGGKGWDQAFGQRVAWVVNQQVQAAEIKLNPPNLGAIEVRVNVDGDEVQVSFTAQQGLAREALEAAIPRLREMFAEQGLNLADVDVSPRDSGEGRGREAAEATQAEGADGGDDDAFADSDEARAQSVGQGLVDYFV